MKNIIKVVITIILVGIITLICCLVFIKPNKLIKYFQTPIVNSNLTTNNNNHILKLNHTINYNFESNDILNVIPVNIKVGNLPETKSKSYEGEEYLKAIVKYIKDNFNIDIDHRWNFTINFNSYNGGMVYFEYTIGEIVTNKNINFSFVDGVVSDIYYKCLDYEINEEVLVNAFIKFADKYKQEEVKISNEEKVLEEKINYIYFYNCDKFLYSYILTTSYIYEGLERYNHYETSYFIDEKGNALE